MSSSSPAARAFLALAALAALLMPAGVLSGCAHARAARSEPARPVSAGSEAARPGRLDPSEEITPEELATIPEPVPAASGNARPATPAKSAPKAPGEAAEPLSGGGEGSAPGDAAPPVAAPPVAAPPAAAPEAPASPVREPAPSPGAGPWIWRVQILATPDRDLAERVAKEAAERLGTTARIDEEPPLHKVRLGGFASEAAAQILKSRAVEMGYPGAFRVKIRASEADE